MRRHEVATRHMYAVVAAANDFFVQKESLYIGSDKESSDHMSRT